MKQLKLIFGLLLLLPAMSFAQLVQHDDGRFYDHAGKPYSGVYIEYYPGGNKRVEMNLTEGQKHGKTILYFKNDSVQEIRSFYQDLMDGTWITFNDKSVKVGEANYLRGVKHGKWYIWDDNGVLRYEMEYLNGAKCGTWKIWDDKGVLVNEKTY
ncbi:MORN repeat protein [Breznakibacter xylanolyticus]|uniref:MORN repeat protein n=1 Tax=Breznakibacter xylanolyticus TaxID=990 RepID=A0A2W7NJ02_9BACT|nr:toxin-antitoxin system YwqK family antitoxin [Breznakibacter xylanolyticus]MBN2743477.1 toxin-antitoxin system YwqK family antitoxin [Marinilabiliaceae bacterium]PZX16684.1 MORN repeat protein [Breznakibacter xylanolyticus]